MRWLRTPSATWRRILPLSFAAGTSVVAIALVFAAFAGTAGATYDNVPFSVSGSTAGTKTVSDLPQVTTAASHTRPVPLPGAAHPTPMTASRPTRVDIPAVGVHAVVRPVGLNADGSLEVMPAGAHYDDVGWFNGSPTPGQTGPAVLAGHLDSAANGRSVFYLLATLTPGNSVTVTRADGTRAVFEVTAVRRFPKAKFPSSLVYGNTAGPELRLITCGGPIDQATGHYRDNTIVWAVLRNSQT